MLVSVLYCPAPDPAVFFLAPPSSCVPARRVQSPFCAACVAALILAALFARFLLVLTDDLMNVELSCGYLPLRGIDGGVHAVHDAGLFSMAMASRRCLTYRRRMRICSWFDMGARRHTPIAVLHGRWQYGTESPTVSSALAFFEFDGYQVSGCLPRRFACISQRTELSDVCPNETIMIYRTQPTSQQASRFSIVASIPACHVGTV